MLRRNCLFLAGWGQWKHRHGQKTAWTAEDHRKDGSSGGEEHQGGTADDNHDPGHEWEENRELEPEYMKLMEAYGIFGYKLGDKIEAGELRKRFKRLALKAHPDQGGSEEDFRNLIEAQKLMLNARHDKHTRTKTGKKKTDVPKSTYEYRGKLDFMEERVRDLETAGEAVIGRYVDVVIILTGVGLLYWWVGEHVKNTVLALNQTRGRLAREEMHPEPEVIYKPKGQWHAWRANNEDIRRLNEIENWATPDLGKKERARRLKDGTLKEAPLPGTPQARELYVKQKEERAEAAWRASPEAAAAAAAQPTAA